MLPADLLPLLREWWKAGRQQGVMHSSGWLFPGRDTIRPISTRQLHCVVVDAARAASSTRRAGPHTLRHSFATHRLEDGVDIRVIQVLPGHSPLETTALYTKVATRTVRAIISPLDRLGKLFCRLFLTRLRALSDADRLAFWGQLAPLAARRAFMRYLAPVHSTRWVVYAKPPFAGPKAVLACLSRYTHCVAISNRRLLAFNENGVTFRYKDYRRGAAHQQQKIMTPATDEFIRRFMLHVLPRVFHRIRHYGLLASSSRKASLARMRELLNVISTPTPEGPKAEPVTPPPCPYCGGPMINIQILPRWCQSREPHRATDPAGGSP
ncbi:transposase [Komagataeibacter xylinus]|uniref:Tyr recombinase domain-containing protein n=3 Tax=Komagataeibacter TaxID=1434011 RepID=A0A2V4S8P9_9PROT|nr:putative transposase [Komagataeibacter xylinus E25]KPH85382.1 putative transposase [Komagataeibacter intermedius AF2]PYD68378.1 hypothetical protein CFR76_15445 [Komagataeibacter swingsii]RFP03823.1 transposase [Komagataeibacter xylinus]RFP03886.1 transposase [Komagataeibacter xylinus]